MATFNPADFTGSSTVNTTKLTVASAAVNIGDNSKDDIITVAFSEKPQQTLALDKINYAVLEHATGDAADVWTNATAVDLSDATFVMDSTDATTKTVKITLGNYNLKDGKTYKVIVSNVTDIFGNVLDAAQNFKVTAAATSNAPALVAGGVTETDTAVGAVTMVFDKELKNADVATNYSVNSANALKATYTWDATKKQATVVLDLATALTAPADVTLTQTSGKTNVTNLAGKGFASATITAPVALVDRVAPQVTTVAGTTASGLDNDTVVVTFNEALREADAINGNNYTIKLADGATFKASDLTGAAPPNLTYNGATFTVSILLDNKNGTTNKTKYNLTNGSGKVTVTVSGVKDLAGNVIETVTKLGNVTGDTTAPNSTGANATVTGLYTMTIAFDEELDATTVTKDDFAVVNKTDSNAPVTISSIELGTDLKTVTITTATPLDVAKTYTIKPSATSSVSDLAGNAQTAFTEKDTAAYTPPTAPNTATVKAGTNPANYINIASKADVTATVGFAGAATGVVTVTLTDTDSKAVTKTAAISGATSVDVTGIDASGLKDGTITVKAKITDAKGFDSTVFGGTDATKDIVAPTTAITSATYDVTSGALVITGTGFETTGTLDVSKITVNGVTLNATQTTVKTIDSATQITVTVAGTDKTAVNASTGFNANGAKADALAVAEGFMKDAAGNSAPAEAATGNTVTVSGNV
jgi:hypothetical protein